jgi:hypothetical protein
MDAAFVLFRGPEDRVELIVVAARGRSRAERLVLLRF